MAATLLLIALLFGGVAPEPVTAWMAPERFGLSIGMTPEAARAAIVRRGATLEEGKEPGHLVLKLDARRTVTLAFEADALRSIRFELVGFLPQIPKAFREVEAALTARHGEPSRRTAEPPILMFDEVEPAIYVVAATDPKSEIGKQGLGFLVVRYFEPPPAR